ncbi:MAG: PKD domain-containing protein [Gammaproteobacteria bacterium]|nr:MAG: PKD domain-containing protein [Gammaproteobacteria bacterium]
MLDLRYEVTAGDLPAIYFSYEGIMKMSNKLWRKVLLPISGIMLLQSASSYAAHCEYVIQSEWGSGFTAAVRITNDTKTAVNGWSVNWSYADGSKRTGGWNAIFSGSNPYSATNVGWNGQINPGQTAEFGIQGDKGVKNAPAVKPTITGAVCGGSSVSSVRSSSSSVSSSSLVKSSSVSIPKSSSLNNVSSSARSTITLSSASRSFSSAQSSVLRNSASVASLPSSARSPSSVAVSSGSPSSWASSSWQSTSHSYSSWGDNASSSSNSPPIVDLKVSMHGLTVFFDASGSTDPDGDKLTYTIYPGDDPSFIAFTYPTAWHTYKQAGEYEVLVIVRDQETDAFEKYPITVKVAAGNQPPVARITGIHKYDSAFAFGGSSYDPDGDPLTYEWDFGDGPFIGDAHASMKVCGENDSAIHTFVTLIVSDGELKNMTQTFISGQCGEYDELVAGLLTYATFFYRVEGNTVVLNAGESHFDTGLVWDFGDGSTGTGIYKSHTYASPGIYNIKLTVQGANAVIDTTTQSVGVGQGFESSQSSYSRMSSSRVSSSVRSSSYMSSLRDSSSAISSSTSSARSSSSQASSDRNRYTAPRATTAPVIDGVVDSVWERASWAPINVFWLGTQSNPSAQDYSGRYKALWDENYLYILYDITDDRIYDGVRDALDRYWEDDTVELFIDENKNGGQHGYNTSAWAYHISTYGDVVDSTTGGAKLLNDHIDSRLVSNGTQHYWELRIRIYGEDYADWKSNTPLQLYAGKLMGFSACYIDNDGSSQRESMMGSVDTQGHKNNQGYLDASVFGSMLLTE